jgi:phytoene dehydrogenase-like protein
MENRYDVIIIGAGIGGLVCGCYLARSGLKVLIIEQHDKPGGYCTSFVRQGYKFDVGVHYLGGVRRGVLKTILEELQLEEKIEFCQFDPTDKIIMPDSVTYIRANPYDTVKEFVRSFPKETKNIEQFFSFVMQENILDIYMEVKKSTFKDILDNFFCDERVKASIGVLLLGNIGLPPVRISAFTAIVLLREFILDPGYYPLGGMQKFADSLADEFKNHNGVLLFSQKVMKICTKNEEVEGIMTSHGEKINSKIVVSNVDSLQTFKHLLDMPTRESTIVDKLIPSISIFACYLGIDKMPDHVLKEDCNIWSFSTYDMNNCYDFLRQNISNKDIPGILFSFPSLHGSLGKKCNKNVIQLFTLAPYETPKFWEKYKNPIEEKMMLLAEKVIPNLREYIGIEIIGTPLTFERYTSNYSGAAYGWASTPEQVKISLMPQKTSVVGLFLVGHWCTLGGGQGGVSTVALSGKRAALEIINQLS